MKAVVFSEFGGTDRLELREVPTPTPAHGEVRVRVRAASLNHLDIWTRMGAFGGNMDYAGLNQGVKVMLPVNEPGALLFIGLIWLVGGWVVVVPLVAIPISILVGRGSSAENLP